MSRRGHLLYQCLGILAILFVWQVATLFFPPLVVPPIGTVLETLLRVAASDGFLPIVGTTVFRLLAGLAIGIAIGAIVGLLSGLSDKWRDSFSPLISVFQSVPPVCWVVLALVWFGFNGKPCIFIVAAASMPTVAINISHGVRSIDKDLLEMARLYDFSRKERIFDVVLPSVKPYLASSLEMVVGGGWKLAVMGEVLTTASGIGGEITKARLNIEPDAIIAWAILLVVCSFLTSKLLVLLVRGKRRHRSCCG